MSERTGFQQAITAAGDKSDPLDRITAIKRAVTSEIRAADPSVSVKFTEYFNHSFAPDMVLHWPTENRERLLFVRPNASERWLLNGLRFVSTHHPLVFTLEDLPSEGPSPSLDSSRRVLREEARATDTWITDPSGIAAISSVRSRESSLGLLSQALVRGGRGVAGGDEITDLTEKTQAGFVASAQLSELPTRAAVKAIENNLDAEQSARLTRVLRAVWEGHGGSSSRFPKAESVGHLTDDDLSYLLTAMDDAPSDFWRRIGRTITTAQLARVRVEDPSASLQALVLANLEHLQAKGIRVIGEPFRLGESDEIPRWLISKGCLALRGLNWTAYVAARRAEEMPPADDSRAPDLTTLKGRATEVSSPITQIQFGRDDRAVTYESKDGTDVLDDPGLQQVAADLRITAVERAVAALEGDRSVGLDFSKKTAIGPTSAVFPLGTLVRSVLPLLSDLDEEELIKLRGTLEPGPPPDGLFGT
jgi:hypothetical protein